ncbi:unnamed protein product [Hyaloperonospora brassicae]|uniref:RxLR effector candidate protein n=1 Tax=Hyaloperonospora brassicae TaxID=162125 RepID=A0AAV0TY66_HYABA|nr:unnamed protein product [Hyaloperonospora brassicae]
MKRSRACDDLVALAAESVAHCAAPPAHVDATWPPPSSPVELCPHGCKRSRASVDSVPSSSDKNTDMRRGAVRPRAGVQTIDASTQNGTQRTWASPVRCSVEATGADAIDSNERHPFRRQILWRKKKKNPQRVAEITSSFDGFGLYDTDDGDVSHRRRRSNVRALVRTAPVEAQATTESRFLHGLCPLRSSRCMDPLVKRQGGPSFDLSALIMLAVSRKR